MRTLICIIFAAAVWQLQAQDPAGSYAGELPHGANAKFIFRASMGDFTTGPLKMQLVCKDVETQDDIITLVVSAQQRRNGNIKAEFPFGGRYVGHFNAQRGVIVGHFSGFAHRGRPGIPRQRFEMAPVTPTAAPPVN